MMTAVSARETLGSMADSFDVRAAWERFEEALRFMKTRPNPPAKSERDLAERLGWSPALIARWRHAMKNAEDDEKAPKPDGWMIMQAADFIGVRAEWIRNGLGNMEVSPMEGLSRNARAAMNAYDWGGVSAAEYDYVMSKLQKMGPKEKVESFWRAKITELIDESRRPGGPR